MRKVYCAIIISLFITGAFAQNVAVVNGKPISNKEFMWVYKKNHSSYRNVTPEDLEAYLSLYINFKLKVLEAKEMGLDKDTAYLAEVKNYEHALRTQKRISKTKPEYVFIMNEYKEAVLMFNISEIKVWNQAQNDENQLRIFYDKNKSVYLQSSFDEVRGQVVTDYQQELENEWIKALRNKYPVKINQDEIRKLARL